MHITSRCAGSVKSCICNVMSEYSALLNSLPKVSHSSFEFWGVYVAILFMNSIPWLWGLAPTLDEAIPYPTRRSLETSAKD